MIVVLLISTITSGVAAFHSLCAGHVINSSAPDWIHLMFAPVFGLVGGFGLGIAVAIHTEKKA